MNGTIEYLVGSRVRYKTCAGVVVEGVGESTETNSAGETRLVCYDDRGRCDYVPYGNLVSMETPTYEEERRNSRL